MQDLGTLVPGLGSAANGINDAGHVVGQANVTPNGNTHAFADYGGGMVDLAPRLNIGSSRAFGINNNGDITGDMIVGGVQHAFVLSISALTDLGTLGGSLSLGYAINASGQVVGESETPGDLTFHAFLYHGGVMTDLGTLGGTLSYAKALNDNGEIVGVSTLVNNTQRPFVYKNGVMADLNSLTELLPAEAGRLEENVSYGLKSFAHDLVIRKLSPASSGSVPYFMSSRLCELVRYFSIPKF